MSDTPNYKREAIAAIGEDVLKRVARYVRATEEAEIFERLLNNAISTQLRSLPHGEEKYGPQGRFGNIWLCRANNPTPFQADITFTPSERVRADYPFVQSVIGVVNLRESSYAMRPVEERISEEMLRDTGRVMRNLGLRRILKFSRAPNY